MNRNRQLYLHTGFRRDRHKGFSRVGGKNASLGELFNALRAQGVGVIDGFATRGT